MQATMVALYGNKSHDLQELLTDCQNAVADLLGSRFRKYDVRQIHGTIIGLERDEEESSYFINRNFRTRRGNQVQMDFDGLLRFLRDGGHFPFQLQIGGFQNRDYSFVSRGARPFDRCFSIQGNNVVVMGWPLRGMPLKGTYLSPSALIQEARLYPATLDDVRRGAQKYGVLHSYHAKPEDTDNDFFFRIGMIDEPDSIPPLLKASIHQNMRNALASVAPVVVNVELSDLHIIFYESEELPLSSSIVYSLNNKELDENLILNKLVGE
jgi:hypothetical protein